VNGIMRRVEEVAARVCSFHLFASEDVRLNGLCEVADGPCTSNEHSVGSMPTMSRHCIRVALNNLETSTTKV
jgi:hypothetical protein